MNVHTRTPAPKARAIATIPRLIGDRILIDRHYVSPIAALVWTYADGSRDVAEIAGAVHRRLEQPVAESTVWSALDELADAGLLVRRVAPPAGLLARRTRREFLRSTAAVAALALLFPRTGGAEETPIARDSTPPPLESEAATAAGDDATEQAKEAYRKRSAAERDAEQHTKAKRAESFENAPARVAPRDRSPEGAARDAGATGPGAAATPDLGDTGRSNAGSPGEIDQRYYQEQDLKRTQERNLKRQP